MKKPKKIKKVYINMGLLLSFFLVVLIILIKLVFTKGEFKPAYINDFNEDLSGVYQNEVIVDDKVRDYFYLKGLNYTYKENGQIPTGVDQNIYHENRLVNINITYNSTDVIKNLKGYVSLSELQDTYKYYKVYPVNDNGTPAYLSDDYVVVELIENPFTNRPTNQGFNGWVTSYSGATISFDSSYYTRYAQVPVTYTSGNPDIINISFNASWTLANVGNMTGSWSSAFSPLLTKQMAELQYQDTIRLPYSMAGYFKSVSVSFYGSCTGYYDSSGVLQSSCTCRSFFGCTYYDIIINEDYQDNQTYYRLEGGTMTAFIPNDFQYVTNFVNGFTANSNMSGFYRRLTLTSGQNQSSYYSSTGVRLSGNCGSSCQVYELIQYYKNGNPEILNTNETYYYLVTRDTNIIVLQSNVTSEWGSSYTKPFTLTSVHNGTDYRNYYLNVTNIMIRAYADTNIENIQIRSGTNPANSSTTPTGSTSTSKVLFGRFNNLRVGRGITNYGTNVNFVDVIGGSNGNTGSSGSATKYKLIVESGIYQNMSIVNGGTSSYTAYINNKSVYGNDYDRVTNNNNNMQVIFCAAGSWGSTLYGENSNKPMFDLTVKSGSFGTNQYDYSAGLYVGGRSYGTHNAIRKAKIEGGWIYNVIGGPLTATNRSGINDSFIHMVGGNVEVIVGGAGVSATYGNRIIQVTGGTVNYTIFGGSNGYLGSGTDGTVNGDSFIYIGGTAEIGSQANVTAGNTIYGAEAGSVFGIGNGRSGYSTIGSSSNSNIMIKNLATINKNIYGGGNYGATGISGTTTTNIFIDGGVVKDSVYGGGNNNGAGTTSVSSTININMTSGEVEGSIYGGSNQQGIIYGSVNLNMIGGTCYDSVYGGGEGGYTSSSSPGTYVRDAINLTIGSESSVPIITNNLYGGSAFGTVNRADETLSLSSYGINMVINNMDISGSVYGGSKGSASFNPKVNGHIIITVNDGTIPDLFGGNDMSGSIAGNTTINLNGGTITNVYGGGNQVSGNNSFINLNGSTATNIFGGSNQSGNMISSTITLTSGSVTNVYGGNNVGGKTTTSNIEVKGGTLTNVYGGGKLADTGKTNITLTSGSVPYVYGGGESASIDTDTNIELINSSVDNLFGGSNQSGNVPISNIDLKGGTSTNVYGGNNAGGKTTNSYITTTNGTFTNIYGGGRLADTGKTTIDISGGTISNVYGGGDQASIDVDTNIHINSGTITNVYGGSNNSGTIINSNIHILGGSTIALFGGNNMGGTTTNTYITVDSGNVTSIYGGGNQANTTTSNIQINNNSNQINYVYGGGNAANVTTSNVDILGGNIKYVYGGSNQSGIVTTSNVTVNNNPTITDIYGGNNAGGSTTTSNIDTNGGTINNVFGGGNQAYTGSTNLNIINTTINNEIYGGGKDGALQGSASTKITDSDILGSVYSGGKGSTAVVIGSTTLNIEGSTIVGEHVFGGGNAAATGTEALKNSSSIVNIAGAEIGGNVYGGANTSVVYGTTEVNIGNITNLDNDKITIGGTVFGGGEANASGSEIYDFSFISVTNGININIKNTATNDIEIDGSIFGSGNASSTTGASYIYIDNYGTEVNHKRNISIQRATLVTLNNSHIELFGATDRTNEYSNVLFSLSRINELKLSDDSSIYLETGTNLLKKFTSVVDTVNNVKANVLIDDGTITKNVNNRLYALEGVNINVATNESITSYGIVSGMTFFGMYLRDGDGNVVEAFYNNSYDNGDTVNPGEFYTFSSGSYVLGSHVANHNIEVDGFYTNYQDEENEDIIEVKYIDPIPESSNYYMWTIGEIVSSYEVDLIASRFSTLGAYELSLINSPDPNTTFSIIGVNYNGLPSNFELVDSSTIPRVSIDGTSDTKMALTMRSSNTGWITVGETKFYTANLEPIGTTNYLSENSSTVPSLLFNLYHSKNISSAGDIGTVVLNLVAIKPIDDLNNEITRVNININLSKALYTSTEYEGALTSGEEHELFVSTNTNITDKSKLSAYYSLFIDNTNNIYQTGYHRSLVSSFVLPENTKITMIDFTTATPTYYYYITTAQDVISATAEFNLHNEASYKLSKFIKMGSTSLNNNYDDATQNSLYYDPNTRIANEEFIFIVDYEETNITSDKLNSTLLLEIRDSNEQTMIGVLGINYSNLTYDIYNDQDALVGITASLSKQNIYIKEATNLIVNTNFTQAAVGGVTIHDTTYYYKKLGLKLSVYDENNNQLNGASLLGVTFTLNGITYYPRMDGTTRINISPKVANVLSNITIDTSNSTLPSGAYTIKVESFGSTDGIYYGLVSSDTKVVTLNLLNNIYGLKTTIADSLVNIDKTTGKTANGNSILIFNVEYASGLSDPNLRISLKRRDYSEIYSLDYVPVDMSDYFTHAYTQVGDLAKYEYLLSNNLQANQIVNLYLKNNLVTGTYKVGFALYDDDNFIGEVYNYIIIR